MSRSRQAPQRGARKLRSKRRRDRNRAERRAQRAQGWVEA